MARREVEFKSSSTYGNHFVVETRFAMKLMGTSRLHELVRRARNGLDGAVPALLAELEAGSWRSMAEIAQFYPSAVIEGFRIRIPLDGGYRIDLLADCEAQMVLIEYAGMTGGARAASKAGSKVI
jgi:hypothetical protein